MKFSGVKFNQKIHNMFFVEDFIPRLPISGFLIYKCVVRNSIQVIGRFIFDETLNGERYLIFL